MTLEEILTTVSEATGYSVEQLKGKRGKNELVNARQIYCYIAKQRTPFSLTFIGQSIARDHTTIIHSIKTIESYLNNKDQLTIHHIETIRCKNADIVRGMATPKTDDSAIKIIRWKQ